MILDDPKISNIHSQPKKKLKSIELMCPGISSRNRGSLLLCLSAEEGRFDRSSQECGRWKMK